MNTLDDMKTNDIIKKAYKKGGAVEWDDTCSSDPSCDILFPNGDWIRIGNPYGGYGLERYILTSKGFRL